MSTSFSSDGWAQEGQKSSALNILLTNDNGYDAAGIMAIRKALRSAGYNVTLIAPAENQSGNRANSAGGKIDYDQTGDGIWAISGTPATAV